MRASSLPGPVGSASLRRRPLEVRVTPTGRNKEKRSHKAARLRLLVGGKHRSIPTSAQINPDRSPPVPQNDDSHPPGCFTQLTQDPLCRSES